jgi:hypothetical protein
MFERMKESRRIQTKIEIKRFLDTVEDWKERRTKDDSDYHGQHNSQIKAITEELNGAAKIIETEISNLDLKSLSLGEVYAKCTQTERRSVWLWRVFEFFRSKFDQRDDEKLKPILQAADEVVWSCYKPFFQNSGIKIEPAPLPFIGEDYSPSALRKDRMPGSLYKQGADFAPLKEYLDQLPIPILQLPPNIVTSHWALVLIGHEVGHFIQPLISEDYEDTFREVLAKAVEDAGGDENMQQRWREWAPEVFADWYSVLTMGQWALWTMAQFEFQVQTDMLKLRRSYPSALARLSLLAQLVDFYVPNEGALILQHYGIMPNQLNEKDKTDELKIIPSIAKAVCQSFPNDLDEPKKILDFQTNEYEAKGRVEKYADKLLANKRPDTDKRLNTARYIASGAAQAWSKAINDINSDMKTVNENLKECLTDIVKSAPDGKRSIATNKNEKKPNERTLIDFISKAVEEEDH